MWAVVGEMFGSVTGGFRKSLGSCFTIGPPALPTPSCEGCTITCSGLPPCICGVGIKCCRGKLCGYTWKGGGCGCR